MITQGEGQWGRGTGDATAAASRASYLPARPESIETADLVPWVQVGVNVILNMALSAGGSRSSGGSSSGEGRAAKAHPVAASRQGVGNVDLQTGSRTSSSSHSVGRMRDSAEIECVLASPPFPWALMLLTSLAVQRLRSAQMIVYPDFVSLSERYARIIANQQVANRVSEAEWRLALDAPIDHVRTGRIGEGFIPCFSRPQPTPQSMEAFLY
jgi:hypothetical protein